MACYTYYGLKPRMIIKKDGKKMKKKLVTCLLALSIVLGTLAGISFGVNAADEVPATKANDIKTTKYQYTNLSDWSFEGGAAKYNGTGTAPTLNVTNGKATIAETASGDASHGKVIKVTSKSNATFTFIPQAADKLVEPGIWRFQYSVFVPADAEGKVQSNQFWISNGISCDFGSKAYNDKYSSAKNQEFNCADYDIPYWGAASWVVDGSQASVKGQWVTYTTYSFIYKAGWWDVKLQHNNNLPVGSEIDDISAEWVCSFADANAAITSGKLSITKLNEAKADEGNNTTRSQNRANLCNYLNNIYGTKTASLVKGTDINGSVQVNGADAAFVENYKVVKLTAVSGALTKFDAWYYDGNLVSDKADVTIYSDPANMAKLEARFSKDASATPTPTPTAPSGATPTPTAAPTPTPRPLVNLLVEAGDYPEIKISNKKTSGKILDFMGDAKSITTFVKKGDANYVAANDLDGTGYLVVEKRDKATAGVAWDTNYTGPIVNVSKLAKLYGEGKYTFVANVKLLSGNPVNDGNWTMQVNKDAESGSLKSFGGGMNENLTVSAEEFTQFVIKINITKEGEVYYVSNEDGSKKIAIDLKSPTNRLQILVNSDRDVIFAGLRLTEASHYASSGNKGGDSNKTGDFLPVALVSLAAVSGIAAVVVARKKKEQF